VKNSLVLLPALLLACGRPPGGQPPTESAAIAIVSGFVAAETLGNWRRADSLVRWASCEGDPAEDFLRVTRGVRLGDTRSQGDTMFVPTTYDVIGQAWSYDQRRAGKKNWRFSARPVSETVAYGAFADSAGRLWIACGDFHQDHVAASQFRAESAHLDDSSQSAWRAAIAR